MQVKRPVVKIEQMTEGIRISISIRNSLVIFSEMTPEELVVLEGEFVGAMRKLRDTR